MFGAGGVAVEVMDDTAIALPPLDDVLASDLIGQTRIGHLLAGFRDRKPADRRAILAALNGLSQMVVDFPCLVSMGAYGHSRLRERIFGGVTKSVLEDQSLPVLMAR